RQHTRSNRDWSSDVCSSDLDLNQAVVLVRREWTAFLNQNAVADAGGLVFVVDLHAWVVTHDLAVQSVLLTVFQLDNNGLVHLVRNHNAGTVFAIALVLLGIVHNCLTHVYASASGTTDRPSSRSRRTV